MGLLQSLLCEFTLLVYVEVVFALILSRFRYSNPLRAPAIKASNRDIAVAVANTVAFGTIGMLTFPYLFHSLCLTSEQVGMCLGVSIHDTSQVLGSAMSYKEIYGDEVALKVAAVT